LAARVKLWLKPVLARAVRLYGEWYGDPVVMAWGGELPSFKDSHYRKAPVEMIRECVRRKGRDGWTPTTTHVLMCLMSRIDIRRNRAELSQRALAQLTGLDWKTALRHARLLHDAGWIDIRERKNHGGRNSPNLFRLMGKYAGVILYGEPTFVNEGAIPTTAEISDSDSHEGGENVTRIGIHLNTLIQTLKNLNTTNTRARALSFKKDFSGNEAEAEKEAAEGVDVQERERDAIRPETYAPPAPAPRAVVPGLGFAKTQELIAEYGEVDFHRALALMQAKTDIKNPAGWMIGTLKQMARLNDPEKRAKFAAYDRLLRTR
jgi:predicted transcriptional regulator